MILTQAVSRVVSFCRAHRKTQALIRATASAVLAAVFAPPQLASATVAMMETSLGGINIELYDADAPGTVANFLKYVGRGDTSNGGYNGTFIHRSEPGFVIQGGGFFCPYPTSPSCHITTDDPIPNEYSPAHPNSPGTISMALTLDQFGNVNPDSATSEWFINLADNSADLAGYTVFGHVLGSGMDVVVDVIAALPRSQLFLSPFQAPIIGGTYVFINRICINNDVDGACPETEDMAPGGDGNSDGIQDRDQPNVTTILMPLGGTVTYAADTILTLGRVDSVDTYTAWSLLTEFISPPGMAVSFYNGMYRLAITGNMGASGQQILFFDGAAKRPTHYYAYGPTPDNPTPHWYDFAFDGRTGAEIKNDRIILHFADGERGDGDLDPNSITHTGAQAVLTAVDDGSPQGGGCSIAGTSPDVTRSGDWIVVSLFLAMLALARRAARRQIQRERVTNIASP